MYMCPSCRRRWTDENAQANGGRCYRACDTPLVHMETEAGHHLNYLPEIVLGAGSGFDNLREAVLAVEPGGNIGIPPSRHTEPLVLDKPMTLKRVGSPQADLFLEIETAPAVRVSSNVDQKDSAWLGPVILEDLTIFRGGSRDGHPLIVVESGELVLRNCRVDGRRGPGVLVKKGARLRCEDTRIIEPGSYGIHCEDGATLDFSGGEFIGGQGHVSPIAQSEESESAPFARGAGLSSAEGASVAVKGAAIRGFRVGLALKGCGGSVEGVKVQGCELAVLLQDPASLELKNCFLSGEDNNLLTVRGGKCRLTGCEFNEGGVQVTVSNGKLEILKSTFQRSSRTGLLVEDAANVRVQEGRFLASEGNGLVVSKGSVCEVTQSGFLAVAGVGVLALAGAEPVLEDCTLTGSGVGLCALPKSRPQIRNTSIRDSVGSGVLLQDGAQGKFESLTVEGSGADQFVVGRSDEPVELRICTFRRGAHGAIRLVDGARAVLLGNTIENQGGDGVCVGGNARIHMDDTSITGCGGRGLLLGPVAKARLEDCTLSANGSGGIRSFEASAVQASRCTFEDNGLSGLFLDRVTRVLCEETSITGSGGPGIVLSGTVGLDEESLAELSGCRIEGNAGEGILGMGAGRAKVDQCTLADNEGAAFRVCGSFNLEIEGGVCRRGYGPPNRIGRGAAGKIQGCRFEGSTAQLVLSAGAQARLANNSWPGSRWKSIRPWAVGPLFRVKG